MLSRRIKGQTLIEVMISLLFITVSAIALVRFQNYLAYDTSLVQQKAEAMLLAVSKIETLTNFQVLNNTSGYTSYQGIASGTTSHAGNTAVYTITTTVTTYTNPTYKNVSVTVSWTDRYGGTQSIQHVTNIAGIDPQYSSVIM